MKNLIVATFVAVTLIAANASTTTEATTEKTTETQNELPTDPFQRSATKALRGDYGPLEKWQRDAYVWGLANDIKCKGLAKVTSYGYKWESAQIAGGTRTASGSYVHTGGCAANPRIPFGALIWTKHGLRYVNDRGGWVKLGYVAGAGGYVTCNKETANFDYYTEKGPLPTLRRTPWAEVKSGENTTKSVWHWKGPR